MSDPNPQPSSFLFSAISIHAATDIGLRREENQDSFGVIETPQFKVCMVADGMGGVRGGATASKIAIDVIRDHLSSLEELSTTQIINAITRANTAIFEKGSSDAELNGMGTTLVLLGFTGDKLIVAHVGDSRAYRIRNGVLSQLTEDHTLVNELIRAGSLSSDQIQNHPVSHMLTRSLGPVADVEVDCLEFPESIATGDKYLLCSDGLYNMVHSEEFMEVFGSVSLEETPSELISLANLRGGTDNITAICISIAQEQAEQQEHSASRQISSSPKIEAALDESKLSTHAKQAEGAAKDKLASAEGALLRDEEQAQAKPLNPNSSRIRYAIVIAAISAIITVSIEVGRTRPFSPSVVESPEITLVTAPPSLIEPPASSTSNADYQPATEESQGLSNTASSASALESLSSISEAESPR